MLLETGVPESHPRSGFAFYLMMIIIISGCLMAVCYLTLLESWYGEVVPPWLESNVPVTWANGLKIVLLDNRCPGEPARPEVEAWRHLLERAGLSFRSVARLSLAPEQEIAVLVLPAAICVDETEREAIRRWLSAGGGLVATGGRALRGIEESGEFWKEVAGVELTRAVGRQAPIYVTLAGQPPLGLGLAPGERWRLRPGPWAVAASSAVDGYWSEADLRPLAGAPFEQLVAVTHRSTERGRVVWIGPGLDAIKADESNQASWERMFLNGVYWAGRRPLAAVSNWPGGQRVAVVVAQEVHHLSELADALAMARTLRNRQIPATFFVRLPSDENPDGLSQLARLAEVAVLRSSAGGSLRTARTDVVEQKERLQRFLQDSISGFRAPDEPMDGTMRRVLAENGYRYYFGDWPHTSAAPRIFRFPESVLFPLDGRTVVGLPRLGKDDFTVLSQYEGPAYSTDGIAEQLREDFQVARYTRGLYVLAYRTDLLGSRWTRPAILRLLDFLAQEEIWWASASEVAAWGSRREQISAEVAKLSRRRIRLVVSNEGKQTMENVLVHIALPYLPAGLRVTSTVFGGQRVAHRVLPELEVLQIRVPRLEAQSNQTWVIDLLPEAEGLPLDQRAGNNVVEAKSKSPQDFSSWVCKTLHQEMLWKTENLCCNERRPELRFARSVQASAE